MNCQQGISDLINVIIQTLQATPEKDYSRELDIYNGATLGKHFRHIYDFFNCVITQNSEGRIDYALRDRDGQIEVYKSQAMTRFEQIKLLLNGLDEHQQLDVYADFCVENDERPMVRTTLGRELIYAYDHAVHHLAIIKIGLQSLNSNLLTDDNLGVATSSIDHQICEG